MSDRSFEFTFPAQEKALCSPEEVRGMEQAPAADNIAALLADEVSAFD
jgi:hypothetical protein